MNRVGIGYDIHPLDLTKGNLYLGGVLISNRISSVGHSDGDALIHAMIDSLLGAINKGNIGIMFPENEKNRNRNSEELLCEIFGKIGKYVKIINIDSIVVLENIKINPFIINIKENISRMLNLDLDKISCKPKSGNGFFKGYVMAEVITLLEKKEGY